MKNNRERTSANIGFAARLAGHWSNGHFTISKLSTLNQSRGGMELSATYRAKLNRRSAAGDAVRCPGF